MHLSDAILLAGLAQGAAAAAARDNCFRAVASNSGAASACSAFYAQPSVTACTSSTTVTTFTSTTWVSPTVANKRTAKNPQDLAARATTSPTCGVATAVPSFASFCSGASRFASACNANSYSGSIVTTVPPVTTTTTSSLLATSTLNACSQRTLNLKIVGGPYDGVYLAGGMFLARGSTNPTYVTQFTLDAQGQLSYSGSSSTYYVQEAGDPTFGGSYIVNGNTPQQANFVTPKCSVAADATFTCTADNFQQPGFSNTFFAGTSASALTLANSISNNGTPVKVVAVNLACSS